MMVIMRSFQLLIVRVDMIAGMAQAPPAIRLTILLAVQTKFLHELVKNIDRP